MTCPNRETISLFRDGELDQQTCDSIRRHVKDCPSCRMLLHDYEELGESLRSWLPLDSSAQSQEALDSILAAHVKPWWRVSIAIPAPLFATMLAALLMLGGWVVRLESRRPITHTELQRPTADASESLPTVTSTDLARFDRGERAIIYKTSKASDPVGQAETR